MKSILRYIVILLCIASFTAITYACSNSGDDKYISGDNATNNESGKEFSATLIDAYEKLTEGKFDEAIEILSSIKYQASEGHIAIEIGMGKAHLGTGDYQNAIIAFKAALSIEPEYNDIFQYLGEAQMLMGDYSAAIETLRLLLEKDPGDIAAIRKLEQALRTKIDYAGLYQFYADRFEAAHRNNSSEMDYYSGKLIEAAQLSKDGGMLLSAIEKLKDTPQGFALEIGFKAYEMLVSGDDDAAKAILFDAENTDTLKESAGRGGCYFGEYNDIGEYQGRGLIIYGSNSVDAVCHIYYGEFSGNKPNGQGTGYTGRVGEYVSLNGESITYKNDIRIEANWKDGIPEGAVVKTDEYFEYSDNILVYSRKTIETAIYKNRLAQGEIWAVNNYYNQNNTQEDNVTIIKHVASDSHPVQFEETVGGSAVMVFEARYKDADSEAYDIKEDECQNCRFIVSGK